MPKILILGKNNFSTKFLYNKLSLKHSVDVIIEESEPLILFYKRRIKKIGFLKVLGQIFFSIFSKFILKPFSINRINLVKRRDSFIEDDIPSNKIFFLKSINSLKSKEIIQKSDADFIVVSGTRIISKKILECTDIKFLNIHAGITPAYRGVHGGYWALVNKERELCGVTLHYLDVGVDTGYIIGHSLIFPTSKDSFHVYPILQLVEGFKMLDMFLDGKTSSFNIISKFKGNKLSSKQYYHPTLYDYLYNRFLNGVK